MKYITRVSTVTPVEVLAIDTNDEPQTFHFEVYGISENDKKFEEEVKKLCGEYGCFFARVKDVGESFEVKFMMEQQEFYRRAIKKNIEKN